MKRIFFTKKNCIYKKTIILISGWELFLRSDMIIPRIRNLYIGRQYKHFLIVFFDDFVARSFAGSKR